MLRRGLAEAARLSEADLAGLLPQAAPAATFRSPPRPARAPVTSAGRRLLRVLTFRPGLAAGFESGLLSEESAEHAAVEFVQQIARRHTDETTTAALLEAARGSSHEGLFDELAAEIFDWEESYDANAELAGLVQKLKRDRESAALREMVRARSPEEWSAEQRDQVREFRRAEVAPQARDK
jgi:hypothetical protein